MDSFFSPPIRHNNIIPWESQNEAVAPGRFFECSRTFIISVYRGVTTIKNTPFIFIIIIIIHKTDFSFIRVVYVNACGYIPLYPVYVIPRKLVYIIKYIAGVIIIDVHRTGRRASD